MSNNDSLLNKIVSLSKRRGFVFQSSEIYGGLKSAFDFGPMGVELKRNIANLWWRDMVHKREDIYGLDSSIIMHSRVWEASGHLSQFCDPLVDCRNCKERFRADKAPKMEVGTEIEWIKKGGQARKGREQKIKGVVGEQGYVCPNCGSSDLSQERQFNLMFRTFLGAVDPLGQLAQELSGKKLSELEIRDKINKVLQEYTVYLRPETAQAMFVQYVNILKSMSPKIPFGIAQIGKSFRNEVTTERFIFRTIEFEQMEMEYFVRPGTQKQWHQYWLDERLRWWQVFANNPDNFRLREHKADELAHYSDSCFDIEYKFPWGWDELEGVASRTDYDLKKHAQYSGEKLTYFDQQAKDPQTGKQGWRYIPYVIEPAAGLTRAVLAFLCDAYTEEEGIDAKGNKKTRVFLKLNPLLAPYKVAVLPLVKKEGLPAIARDIIRDLLSSGINARYDENHSIGKRYSRHDEIGTPFCVTVDHQTKEDKGVTVRDRDSTKQERIKINKLKEFLLNKLNFT